MQNMAEQDEEMQKFWADKVCRTCGEPAQNYVADFDEVAKITEINKQLVRIGESFYCSKHARKSVIRRYW